MGFRNIYRLQRGRSANYNVAMTSYCSQNNHGTGGIGVVWGWVFNVLFLALAWHAKPLFLRSARGTKEEIQY